MSSRAAPPIPPSCSNVRLVGDDVAIEGWMGIGADNKRQGVPLPQLLAQRRHQPRDARQGAPRRHLGRDAPRAPPTTAATSSAPSSTSPHLGDQSAKVRPGLDLRAEMDTVVGFSDTTLRNVKMTLQKRANKLTCARRARRAGGRQAVRRRGAPAEAGPAAPAARRGHGRRPAVQARRLLSQCGRRRR